MKSLSSGDVLEILAPIGITPKMFRGWLEAGHVASVAGGAGLGDHRRFSLMQAIGLAVAAKEYTGRRGCAPSYIGQVVGAFAAVTEDELLGLIKNRGTHFVGPHRGKPLLQRDKRFGWVDVRQTYREVTAAVINIEQRLGGTAGAGRARGLARKSGG